MTLPGPVLFDVDGALLDSYAGYREVWARWSTARGVDFEVTYAATHGRRPVDTVAAVAAHLDPAAEYVVLKQILASVGERFPPYPGARDLLRALPADRWGVVTSGERATVLRRFDAGGLTKPRVLVDGRDVSLGKPSPEGYLLAADLLQVSPSLCLVVEDAPAGVAAGKAAGMRVIAVATTHDGRDLAQADHVVGSLAEAADLIRSGATSGPGFSTPGRG